MKPNLFFCCFVFSLLILGCAKPAIVESETQNPVTLPIENSDLKINPIYDSDASCLGEVRALTFVDESKGVCISNSGIRTTKNKGLNWKVSYMSPHIDTLINILDLKVIDKQTIIAIGFRTENRGKSFNIIVKSTDWGDTWQTIYSSTESGITNITVDGNNNLYALNIISGVGTFPQTAVLKSTDLGKTWQRLALLDIGDAESITSMSNTRLFLISPTKGRFLSTNAGETWTRSIGFPAYSMGYSLGKGFGFSQSDFNAEVFKTNDVGDTWFKVYNTTTFLKNMKVVSSKAIVIFGELPFSPNQEKSRMIYTLDEGNTWKEVPFLKNDYARIAFYDDKNGYIITNNGFCFFKITLK
jgi:photosystem II stability/assembly factor-like uncharacterized protein